MAQHLITPLLWAFIPSYVTKQALPILSTNAPALFPPSPPGSPGHIRNYRITYTLIVGAYLIWSFVKSSSSVSGTDWYQLLGVRKTASDEQLKKAFRTLSRTYHPDRAGEEFESHFILIRQAYEVLTDPVKRYAYDRFGPDIIAWKGCQTVKDYIYAGLVRSSGFYILSGGAMILFTIFGKAREASFWTKTLFVILLVLELRVVLSPTLSKIRPSSVVIKSLARPQFIQIEMLHRVWASLSVAVAQLAGVWAPQTLSSEAAWNQLSRMTKELQNEAMSSVQSEIMPILVKSRDPLQAQLSIQRQMEQILVDRTVSTHPLVRDQWRAAVTGIARANRGRETKEARARDLEIACRTPLPPSPRLKPTRL